MDAITTRMFQAIRGQKILIIGSATVALLFSLTAFWLWQIGKMPIYVGVISVIILVSFVGRSVAVTRFPVVEIHDNRMDVYSWFGIRKQFDLSSPIEIAVGSYGIVMKQGRTGAGFGKEVIGKDQFDEFISLLSAASKNGGS